MEALVNFEWDDNKDAENFRKHGIRFRQAIPAFFDEHAVYYEDHRFPYSEQRMILLGAVQDRIIFVVYAEVVNDTIKMISARKAETLEVVTYRRGYK